MTNNLYDDLIFPEVSHRPYFYTNFVSTIDGKVAVLNEVGYWPIGSKLDYEIFIKLREYADCLIHGKNTALSHHTLRSLENKEFRIKRKARNKNEQLSYIIVSAHPDNSLLEYLVSDEIKSILVTTDEAAVSEDLSKTVEVLRFGKETVDLNKLSNYLFLKGYKHILTEGGPNFLSSLIKEDLLDEIFLTLSPKVFGGQKDKTLAMAEGFLLPPNKVQNYKLKSIEEVDNELFLRYQILR